MSLYAKSIEEIKELLNLDKTFIAKQIQEWILKGQIKSENFSNISKSLREKLKEISICSSVITQTISDDKTYKCAIRLEDGLIIEAVLLSDDKGRHTACLSSQVGCAMQCKFCKTGTMGLLRNLKDYEIIEQFFHLNKIKEINNIVFMGMGEPLANLDEVLKACTYIHDNLDFSYRRITISTCGLATKIDDLAASNIPLRLAISLVSADDKQRTNLMPVNKSFDLKRLKQSLENYQRVQNKRITLEYCLLSSVNTNIEDAKKLSKFIGSLKVLVNLIPWNKVDNLPFNSPSKSEINRFCSYLDKLNINYSIRIEKGSNIAGACGQLASENTTSVK